MKQPKWIKKMWEDVSKKINEATKHSGYTIYIPKSAKRKI